MMSGTAVIMMVVKININQKTTVLMINAFPAVRDSILFISRHSPR